MSISLRGWVERSLPVRKSSHHERGFCDLDLESRRSLFGDVAISILNHTDLDLFSGSGSLLCGNLHSANSNLASILRWDRSDLVSGSVDLAGSAQCGQIGPWFRQNETRRYVQWIASILLGLFLNALSRDSDHLSRLAILCPKSFSFSWCGCYPSS